MTTLTHSTARSWRASVAEVDARWVSDRLVDEVDRLPAQLRRAVLRQLDRALLAGIVDPATLRQIVDCVRGARARRPSAAGPVVTAA